MRIGETRIVRPSAATRSRRRGAKQALGQSRKSRDMLLVWKLTS